MSQLAGAHELVVGGCSVLGLLIGSFLNVVVYRVPRHLSVVRPPSHCPACGFELSQWDNIPVVSWLALRGRCRKCRASIALRYPLVEAATAAAFGLAAAFVEPAAALAPVLVVIAAGIAASAIDADGIATPWALCLTSLLGAVGLVAVAIIDGHPAHLTGAAVGAALIMVVATVLAWLQHGHQPGTGRARARVDIRRAALLGAFGWTVGWFWVPGGLLVSAWAALAMLPFTLGVATRRHLVAVSGSEGTTPEPLTSGGAPLGLLALGALGLFLAGAALR